MVRLPGMRSSLIDQVALYRDQLASGSAETRAEYTDARIARMQRVLGTALLGAVVDLIERAGRVYVAPDGPLASLPVGTLIVDGGAGMLMERRDVIQVPSAGVLEWVRTRRRESPRGGVLAMAPVARELRGADDEVAMLGRRYRDVSLLRGLPAGDALERAVAGRAILHVAAHATVNDDSPWLSSFVFDTRVAGGEARGARTALPGTMSPEGARADSLLMVAEFGRLQEWRASQIARMSLPVGLAVLSGCETAGGRMTTGEGVLGLTSAFISAGAPVVVSSQWPVDDRVTTELMGRFYRRLAGGEAVGAALRHAQLELRARRGTSHPFFWAGFVVIGDGERTVRLERAPRPVVRESVLIALAVLALAALSRRVRWRRRGAAPSA
jgi:CHAT domain-containing protein